MSKHARVIRVAAATVACAASLGFAACGDDDGDGETTPATEASGATGATGEGGAVGAAFQDELRTNLEKQGLSDEVIDCIFEEEDALEPTVEELDELAGGDISEQLLQELSDLGADCQQKEG